MELLAISSLILLTLSVDVFEFIFEKTGFLEAEMIERKISFNNF